MREWELRIDEVEDPIPGAGQVLTKVLACGICGSDLHMLRYGREMRALMNEIALSRVVVGSANQAQSARWQAITGSVATSWTRRSSSR